MCCKQQRTHTHTHTASCACVNAWMPMFSHSWAWCVLSSVCVCVSDVCEYGMLHVRKGLQLKTCLLLRETKPHHTHNAAVVCLPVFTCFLVCLIAPARLFSCPLFCLSLPVSSPLFVSLLPVSAFQLQSHPSTRMLFLLFFLSILSPDSVFFPPSILFV